MKCLTFSYSQSRRYQENRPQEGCPQEGHQEDCPQESRQGPQEGCPQEAHQGRRQEVILINYLKSFFFVNYLFASYQINKKLSISTSQIPYHHIFLAIRYVTHAA
jgi:hypothetical protein